MTPDLRCAGESAARREPMFGTASTVSNWLLLEHPGPWGHDALLDGRLPPTVGERLRRRADEARVRVVLIRRVGRRVSGTTTALAIHSGPDEPRIERIELPTIEDALELELGAIGRRRPFGLGEADVDPLFLVCTHGRRDVCCAERGRPVAEALAGAFPDRTWESSHLGGDRFAGNLLAFPHGLYFGRLEATNAPAIARAYVDGRLDLHHLRGRSCRPMAVQAAEHALREREALVHLDAVELETVTRTDVGVTARFGTVAGRFEVRLAVEPSPEPLRLTCRSARDERPPRYRVLAIARLG